MKEDTIFPTYNARHYGPKEVAKTFIWSESFGRLMQNNHSVILGARGCGKTTLMKMLTLPALYSWESKLADSFIQNIPFYAVYISTDIYWNVKNQTYGEQLESFGNWSELISKFSVTSNVFTSLCDTFLNILQYDLNDTKEEQEHELCEKLIQLWKLPKTIPKIVFVKEALIQRIDDVNQIIQNLIFNPKKQLDLPYHDFFNLSFESSIEVIIPIFERIYNLPMGEKKWALCFDELEFAPIWLQSELFKSLRSRKQYILYKLSASPILSNDLENSLSGLYRATAGNDYELIKMWALSDNQKFSKLIIESLLKKKYPEASIDNFFETNGLYSKEANSYESGSEFNSEVIQLINKDDSFKKFLEGKGIDLSNPVARNVHDKNTLFRKIKPIVYYRNFFLKEDVESRRSRKINGLLSGIEVLSEICDGNPRWLIGLTTNILKKSDEYGVDQSIQYREIYAVAKRFENVIGNIPVGDNKLTVLDVVKRIGEYFEGNLLGQQFRMDPKSTFVVDKDIEKIPINIIELIEKGVSQGAFILLDTNDDKFDFEVRGQRFKLSYLFHAIYTLPIRKYEKVSLSTCLSGVDLSIEDSRQIKLFDT